MKSTFNQSFSSLRILVLGYLVRGPMGGMAWHHLQYIMGLKRLGHHVCFLEDSGDTEYACYDPSRHVTGIDPSYGLKYAADCFTRLGIGDVWAYYDAHTDKWHGPAASRASQLIDDADLLINLSCSHVVRPWFEKVPIRALVDTDPLYTQIRNLQDPDRKALSVHHNRFFSFGENIGTPHAGIPDDGFPWTATRQPIFLDAWPYSQPPANASLTTVMQWNSYPPLEYSGVRYGMKSDSFTEYLGLPYQSKASFELAIGGHSAPRDRLRQNGWHLHNPMEVVPDLSSYQEFIRASFGEFTVAKEGYVLSRSGWFSERSAAYLASGRSVITQDTGFTDFLPSGLGLHAFDSVDTAIAACDSVYSNPQEQSNAAYAIAAEYFDSLKVLSSLLDNCMM